MRIVRTGFSWLMRIVAAAIIGVLLLALSCMLPNERISANVKKSAMEVIAQEGLYPEITHTATSYLDNWTDSIMLAEAAYPAGEKPLIHALQVPRYVADEEPAESLVRWSEDGTYIYVDYYPQYWHGYLILLRPLLLFTDYSGVRIINGICQVIVAAAICIALWKKGKREFILPFLLSIGMLMPIAMAKSMQFSSCYYIFMLGGLAILIEKDGRKAERIFLYAGILTAYFDFLTYPISTFGVPAVFWLIANAENESDHKSVWKKLGKFFLAWAVGYGLMWGLKLLAGMLIIGPELISATGNHVTHWLDGERWFSVGYVFYFNVRDFVFTPVSLLCMLYIVGMAVALIRKKKAFTAKGKDILPFLALCLMPFLWYLFLFNPSGVHHFFTNKACVVTAFSGMCIFPYLLRCRTGGGAP